MTDITDKTAEAVSTTPRQGAEWQRQRSVDLTGTLVAYVSAVVLIAAAVWFALVNRQVTVPSAPTIKPGEPDVVWFRRYYDWWPSTVGQERGYTILAVVGLLGLAWIASVLRPRLGTSASHVGLASAAVSAGAFLWAVAGVLLIGGHHAASDLATHSNPIDPVNSILYTVDLTHNAFQIAAYTLIGFGMLALGLSTVRTHRLVRWAWMTSLLGVSTLVLAYANIAENGDLNDKAVTVVGALLLPTWLVWSGRILAVGQN